ncbi:hypothetical protein OG871_31065 [Kitasatospora sp. NBC_00374]|uniref:hypothetical protein n=1 Tax=Kitasatospora sp. NBC_00374 TaxID=2975964 RepID=UPI0030DFFB3C
METDRPSAPAPRSADGYREAEAALRTAARCADRGRLGEAERLLRRVLALVGPVAPDRPGAAGQEES